MNFVATSCEFNFNIEGTDSVDGRFRESRHFPAVATQDMGTHFANSVGFQEDRKSSYAFEISFTFS